MEQGQGANRGLDRHPMRHRMEPRNTTFLEGRRRPRMGHNPRITRDSPRHRTGHLSHHTETAMEASKQALWWSRLAARSGPTDGPPTATETQRQPIRKGSDGTHPARRRVARGKEGVEGGSSYSMECMSLSAQWQLPRIGQSKLLQIQSDDLRTYLLVLGVGGASPGTLRPSGRSCCPPARLEVSCTAAFRCLS